MFLSIQLLEIVLNEINYHLAEMYVTVAQGGLDEAAYQKKSEATVGDENCYKFILVCSRIVNVVYSYVMMCM